MAVSDTLINTLFDGRYRIIRKLGTGGMANVYLAEDEVLGRRVAIKILNDRHAGDDQFVERFRREAKNAASLSHPNIVSIYDRGEAEGTYYIAMEYLDGRTLKELITARGPAPIHLAVDYARQILAALRFAHRHGIVHRDIKPHNVLVDGEGRLKVTDFGIARAGTSQMTEAGSIIGTAQYLSPEQARGAPVDQTSDLYSVGVVLYELLTGVVPFSGDTPVEIAMKHLSSVPDPPSAKRAEVPRDLDMVVMRALAKDPAERYHSAEEMDADLRRVNRGVAISPATEEAATAIISRPPPTAVTEVRPRQPVPYAPPAAYYDYDEPPKRAIWPWLVALFFVVAAVVGGYFLYDQVQEQLSGSKTVAVERYVGIREIDAVKKINDIGLKPQVVREPSKDVEQTFVIRQSPQAGERTQKGNFVTLYVSNGPPTVTVPSVVGETLDRALADLQEANLRGRVVRVESDKPDGQVVSQNPTAGATVDEESRVIIRVSKGPQPVAVPNVIGSSFETASNTLLGRGFAVARGADIDSNEPKGTVVDQSPDAGTFQNPGTTITLRVSKGPTTSTVPDVTSQSQTDAQAQLRASGFRVQIVSQPVTDPNQEGIVQTQDPPGGTQAPAGSTVTIAVGRFTESPAGP
jgi:beta-lactam-binding protein with PASTA domain/tRNA A-37 threonylcarbamoyl transferase component Bud32